MTARRAVRTGPGIDWADLKRRVDAAGEAVAGSALTSPEVVRAVLEDRARALARPAVEVERADAPRIITFRIGQEQYGVEPRRVLEITRSADVVPLPSAEPWIAGLTGWRGELVLVVDLRALLGGGTAARPERPTLVVLGTERPQLGVLADAPGELRALVASELRPPPEGLAGREFVRAMTGDAILLLDADRLMDTVGAGPA